jgi:hypothetical protein
MERNVDFAHTRIDELEKEVVAIKTEVRYPVQRAVHSGPKARGYPDWRV